MAKCSLTMEICTGRTLIAMGKGFDTWPQEKVERFITEWRDLEEAGAEMVDVQVFGNRIVGHPSEDFTKHLAAYGVYP